jgi:hypothetical protein
MFQGELSAAVNKYWCVFSGRIIYTEKEEANFQIGRPFSFTKFRMNAQQITQCKQRRVTYLLAYTYVRIPVWIETTVWLFLLYICHTVIHRKFIRIIPQCLINEWNIDLLSICFHFPCICITDTCGHDPIWCIWLPLPPFLTSICFHVHTILQLSMYHCMTYIQ